MTLRILFLLAALILCACSPKNSEHSDEKDELAEQIEQSNLKQDLLLDVFLFGSEYHRLKDGGRKIKNPFYNPQRADNALKVFLRSLNLTRVDKFQEINNPLANPEAYFEGLNLGAIAKPDDSFYDKLKIAGEKFTIKYNAITDEAKKNKCFKNLSAKKSGFYEDGATALQLSLYYQGFNPEFAKSTIYENKYGGMDQPPLNMTPTDDDLKIDVAVRDAQKAYNYALLNSTLFDTSNYANLCLNGIGTKKNADIAALVFSKSKTWNMTAEEIRKSEGKLAWDLREYFLPLYAYMLYHGLGVKKDVAKCDAILELEIYNQCWKNFYCGWFVPKDFDFAIHCLELLNAKSYKSDAKNNAQNCGEARLNSPSYYLIKIYEGKYNPKHKNPKKAQHWKGVHKNKKA